MTDEDYVAELRSYGMLSTNQAAARIEQLTEERDRLALAICGGEDAPGYANAQTVETLEHVAKQNRQSHWATINSLLAEEAERDEALNQLDSARYSVDVLERRMAAVMAERDRLREAIDYILDGMGIADPDYDIDPDDDFLDAANSEWVRDTLTRLAAALKGESHE